MKAYLNNEGCFKRVLCDLRENRTGDGAHGPLLTEHTRDLALIPSLGKREIEGDREAAN